MKAIIKSIGAYAPINRVSNADLSKTMETSDEWIFSHIGIRFRHISAENEAATDVAVPAAKREKIPLEKFFLNIEEYANTSAASIPLALNEMFAKNLIQPNDLILTVGFGGGLTYGGNLIRF